MAGNFWGTACQPNPCRIRQHSLPWMGWGGVGGEVCDDSDTTSTSAFQGGSADKSGRSSKGSSCRIGRASLFCSAVK